jgi:hypothetical protein
LSAEVAETAVLTPTEDEGRAGAVVLAYVHDSDVSYSWHHSMVEMLGWDVTHEARVMRAGYIAYRYGTDGLVDARNKTVTTFLQENQADWLWIVDTDMGFAPDTLDRLFEAADPVERPIVGALCFSQREMAADMMGGWRCTAVPTVYDWAKVGEQMGFSVRWEYPINTITRCAGTGSACILVHRSVFEQIGDKFGPVWYDRIPNTSTGQVTSEDLSFCMRAGALDIPVHIHTGVQTSHAKRIWLSEEDYWRQRAVDPPPYDIPPQSNDPEAGSDG